MIRREVIIGDCRLLLGDSLEILPTLGPVDAVVTDLAAGAAGEHLVCADLLMQGFRAFLACAAASEIAAKNHEQPATHQGE